MLRLGMLQLLNSTLSLRLVDGRWILLLVAVGLLMKSGIKSLLLIIGFGSEGMV
jgi:hypothetical protein